MEDYVIKADEELRKNQARASGRGRKSHGPEFRSKAGVAESVGDRNAVKAKCAGPKAIRERLNRYRKIEFERSASAVNGVATRLDP